MCFAMLLFSVDKKLLYHGAIGVYNFFELMIPLRCMDMALVRFHRKIFLA